MKNYKRIVVALCSMAAWVAAAHRVGAATNIVAVVGGTGQSLFLYIPSNSVIIAGDTVTWTNRSTTLHDVTQGIRPAAAPNPYWSPLQLSVLGTRASVTFSNTGIFPYFCTQHTNQPGPQTGLVSVVIAPTVVLN